MECFVSTMEREFGKGSDGNGETKMQWLGLHLEVFDNQQSRCSSCIAFLQAGAKCSRLEQDSRGDRVADYSARVATLRLRDAISAKVSDTGDVTVWPPLSAPVMLSGAQFSFLLAFGQGATSVEAANRSGFANGGDHSLTAAALLRMGLLETADGVSLETLRDRRNAVCKKFFERDARAWTSSAYDTSRPQHFTFVRMMQALEWINERAADSARCIDLGCGAGHFVVELARRGYDVTGVDSSSDMIELATARLNPESTDVRGRAQLKCADVLTYHDAPVDVVSALGVIQWFDDPKLLFSRASALTKPGGLFVLDCANKLVTPEGAAWLYDSAAFRHSILRLLTDMRTHAVLPSEWVARIASEYSDTAAALRDLAQESDCRTKEDDSPATTVEHRMSPEEIEMLAEEWGFELVTVAGVGEPRTLLDHAVPSLAGHLNRPLAALRELPISVLWSTGFIALLERSDAPTAV